jgi:hypothetical protein
MKNSVNRISTFTACRREKNRETVVSSLTHISWFQMFFFFLLLLLDRMLDDMEHDLDKASTRLDIVTAKTRELIKRSGGVKYFLIIVVLTLVMLVLFFLVIYF